MGSILRLGRTSELGIEFHPSENIFDLMCTMYSLRVGIQLTLYMGNLSVTASLLVPLRLRPYSFTLNINLCVHALMYASSSLSLSLFCAVFCVFVCVHIVRVAITI